MLEHEKQSMDKSFVDKQGVVVWITGLPSSGKTTTAKVLDGKLLDMV
jgi:adenylylsulfate kinase-like enzyme